MKKLTIFIFLLFCIRIYAQADFPEGIQLANNAQDNTATKVNVQTSTGLINWRNIVDFQKEKSYLSTGLLKNGLVTTNADPTKFNITTGIGIITNFSDPENPTSVIVNFPAFTGVTPAYLTSSNITYIAINSTPAVVMQASPFTVEQRRDLIILGAVIHSNLSTINLVNNISAPTNAGINQLHDLMEALGALNISGNKYSANGVNLAFNKSAGTIFKLGVNFANDWKKPHDLDIASQTFLTFRYRTQNGTEGSDRSNLDPSLYDVGNVLTSVPSNKFTIQTVTLFQTGATRVQYGQEVYNTMSEAEAAITTRSYNVEANIAANGLTRAYVILKNTATSLQNTNDTKIVEAGKFGNVGGSGGAITSDAIIAALGYTPENIANKQNSLTVDGTGTKYPTVDAVNSGLINKLDNRFVINDYVSQNPPSEISSSLYESFPLLIRSQSNKVFAYYRQGATHASSKGIIQARTSTDGGGTWTNASTVVTDATYDCRNVSGGVTPTGRIVLFYMRYVYGSSTSFDQGYIYSDNEGVTWSSYNIIPNGTHTFFSPYGKIISIGDGKIMANWYGETPATPTYSSYIITSSDNGNTWSSAIAVATSASIKFGEASYAYLDGGIIIGIIRNSVGAVMQQVKSIDNGATWTTQGAVTFDTGAQVSPELATYIDANNEKYAVCFYANRSDNKLKVVTGSYTGLIAGVSGWNANTRTDLTTHTSTDFGYPSVIKSRENNKFLLSLYKATSTTLASVRFLNYAPFYNSITSVETIKTSNLFRNNRGIGTHLLIDNASNINRWAWSLQIAETGSNSGSDLYLSTFNDDGTPQSNFINFNRNDRSSNFNCSIIGQSFKVLGNSDKKALLSNGTISSILNDGDMIRNTTIVSSFPTTGNGYEIFNATSTLTTFQAYNRDSAIFKDILINAKNITLTNNGGSTIIGGVLRLKGYTVATLPAGTIGDTAYVTDALAPTYNGVLTGGGAIKIPVFHNGTAWTAH